MSTDEVSARRCAWLLTQRGYRYWRESEMSDVLPLRNTTPDFLVEAASGRFFIELKSIEQDTLLDRLDPSVRVFSASPMSLQKRANRPVRDAAEQVLPYADEGLPIVIMLDNYRQKGIGLDRHTLEGLFGELVVESSFDPASGRTVDERWVRVDNGSPLAAGRNAHVSAAAVLISAERFDTLCESDDFSVERLMRVRIVRNPYALISLPPDVFAEPDDDVLS